MTQPLDSKKIQALQTRMQTRLAQLRADVRRALERSGRDSDPMIAGGVADMEDAAFIRLFHELDLADIERDGAEIRDIGAAMRRIEDGRYGLCVDCGDAIAFDRLQAYPSAKRCHSCQQAVETARADR